MTDILPDGNTAITDTIDLDDTRMAACHTLVLDVLARNELVPKGEDTLYPHRELAILMVTKHAWIEEWDVDQLANPSSFDPLVSGIFDRLVINLFQFASSILAGDIPTSR